MSKPVINQYQPSLTEWFADIGEVAEAAAFREEDNQKAARLEVLYQAFGLQYERPEKFSARDIKELSPAFKVLLEKRGDELCAFRMLPLVEGLPKLRHRGTSIRDTYENWFLLQDIHPDQYEVHVCPHSDSLLWSGIFVVKEERVFGQVVRGLHSQLTQGSLEDEPLSFQFDYTVWRWSREDPEAMEQAKQMVEAIRVKKGDVRSQLSTEEGARFKGEYLLGYFESTVWPDNRLYFIDYNRLLPKYIPVPPVLASPEPTTALRGLVVFPGQVTGRVVTMAPEEVGEKDFPQGSVLVCDNTDVRYLPIMRKAAAIITARGGMLSHAAIIARELKIPCSVGVKGLLERVKDGAQVEMQESGEVRVVR